MSIVELYTKGARVWISDPRAIWIGGVLLQNYTVGKEDILVLVDNDNGVQEERVLKILNRDKTLSLPPLRNPEILIGENDLTALSYLNEPEVLYNLQVRFCDRRDIYTYCGIVLVAINPYEELDIYGPELIHAYSGQDMGSMDPHIFAVAEEAYKRMSRFDANQSIIVSGESGAGKTVSAKYTMRYFAMVGGAESETQVERKVLASNPIMESIGNAKTTRNDNSSRFGKYIEIDFNRRDLIVGANMRTYLLEKSRVVYQSDDERNYHLFYQLCASKDLSEFESFNLMHADEFYYTSQGNSPEVNGVDDADELQNTRDALETLGIPEQTQMVIFQIIAAVLHMGNVSLTNPEEPERAVIDRDDLALNCFCRLLGINADQMCTWLCHRSITTVNEVLTKSLTIEEAANARDALAKHIYSELFNWIVSNVNKVLAPRERQNHKFIGVLDIYGFEVFQVNSFEQFCINYANEKLQQQFNMHVFKLEQEEYVKEQIEWSFIDFYDNQPCIDLIESKLGILDLLDEECKMIRGSDANWLQKCYERHLQNPSTKAPHFDKPKLSRSSFIIHHFAGSVCYEMDGFLEKNRDHVLEEQINILKASDIDLVSQLFHKNDETEAVVAGRSRAASRTNVTVREAKKMPKGPNKAMRKTVGTQFRDSLNMLMDTLNNTTPHYIRCIKPNDLKLPFTFDSTRAVQQLRACGVIETVRISAAGFPSRWSYSEFFKRYRVLGRSEHLVKNIMVTSENIVKHVIVDADKYRFGKTKIFFRAGQVAYLEKLRSEKITACGVLIQKHIRGWLQRKKYQRLLFTITTAQRYSRGFLARKRVLKKRQGRAAVRIQSVWRGFRQRSLYKRQRLAALTLQRIYRGQVGRANFRKMLCNCKAIVIQRVWRGYVVRKRISALQHGIVLLQSHFRRRKAKEELRLLKIEARSVTKIKQVNLGLENKIIELQQRLDQRAKEAHLLKEENQRIILLQDQVTKLQKVEVENKKIAVQSEDLMAQLSAMEAILAEERAAAAADAVRRASEERQVLQVLQEDNLTVKQQLCSLEEELEAKKLRIVELEAQNNCLKLQIAEFESSEDHHQTMVRRYAVLQQKYENLCREYAFVTSGDDDVNNKKHNQKGHRRTGSNLSDMTAAMVDDLIEKNDANSVDSLGRAAGRRSQLRPRAKTVAGEQPSDFEITNYKVNIAQSQESDDQEEEEDELVDGEEARHRSSSEAVTEKDKVDVMVMLQLQKKVADLSRENRRQRDLNERLRERASSRNVHNRNDEEVGGDGSPTSDETYSNLKLNELEMLNAKLVEQLSQLQASICQKSGGESASREVLMVQFNAMREELEVRREECLQLKSALANKNRSILANDCYGGQSNIINEDGELEMAYKTMKDVNRKLQTELEAVIKEKEENERDFATEVDHLKRENDRQQRFIRQNVSLTADTKLDSIVQQEITRLTAENLELRERNDNFDDLNRKLKKALKIYAKKVQRYEGRTESELQAELAAIEARKSTLARASLTDESEENGVAASSTNTVVTKAKDEQKMNYQGILEYQREDEPHLIRILITELKPRVAAALLPSLPAYILFMCVRYADALGEEDRVRSLLTTSINAIRRAVKKRHDDLDTMCLWMSNTTRLLHCLKQYSGEEAFQMDNTPRQTQQALKQFDLSEFRQILTDLAVWIYQGAINFMQEQLSPQLIVAAVLEHEGIAGLTGAKPTGLRGRTSSRASGTASGFVEESSTSSSNNSPTVDELIKRLVVFHRIWKAHHLDEEVMFQMTRQLFYWICANALNNLLLRKELCHWSKGMQLRYNLSQLETWLREASLQGAEAHLVLEPVIQASQLLQAKKSGGDAAAEAVCDMCQSLSSPQVVKLLNLYTPVDDFEERVPTDFIRAVQKQLAKRQDANPKGQSLLMNAKKTQPVRFPFKASAISLETVPLPETLELNQILKRH